jgi:hypothetical protein
MPKLDARGDERPGAERDRCVDGERRPHTASIGIRVPPA